MVRESDGTQEESRGAARYLSVRQVAERCGVSAKTVRRWLAKGKFPRAKKGWGQTHPWRIPESDVLALLVAGDSGGSPHRPIVLIVEDDPDLGEIYRFTVDQLDVASLKVAHGESAIEWLKEGVPDVVVLDVMIPAVAGLDILGFIRSDKRLARTKVVVVTAYEKLIPEAKDADVVLMKPVRPIELQRAIQGLLVQSGTPVSNQRPPAANE